MNIPATLKYTKDHEWAKIDGSFITVGITDHAQNSLGDIVFAELPKIGRELKRGETFGVVESIKAVSDLYSPVTGKVIAINESLGNDPAALNRDAYGAWLIKVELTDPSSLSELLDPARYTELVKSLA